MTNRFLFISLLWLYAGAISAQDDLLDMINEEQTPETVVTTATFKGTRIINGHSIETRDKGVLEFLISHRFGTLNSGGYNFWGLDQSNIRLALEYAPIDRLMVGVGRSSFEKTYDGFVKYQLLKQKQGAENIPVSVTWVSSIAIKTLKRFDDFQPAFSDKLSYVHQALIARKVSPALSLQVTPTLIKYNLIESDEDSNYVYAVGFGGRIKLSKRITLNAEYFLQLEDKASFYNNAIAIGFDIETGGHVFQLHFTNATSMIEKGFIGENTNDFFDGDIHFGFNISRAFQLGK